MVKKPDTSYFDEGKSAQYERDRAIEKRREAFAYKIAGMSGVEFKTAMAVLDALRKDYRIIDKSRVVDLHTSRIRTHQEIELGVAPQIEDRLRVEDAIKMGRHLLGTGGIEFEETDTPQGREVRSTLYAIYPEPQRVSMRDEKR